MAENNRIKWLDAMKGIAILLVLFGHSRSEMNFASRICVGCHMPIFFFCGGLTLHNYETFSKGVLVKAKALFYPFITESLLTILFYWYDRGRVLLETVRFEGYGVLWFLPTLFVAEILVMLLSFKPQYSKMFIGAYIVILWCLRGYMEDYTNQWYFYIILRIIASSFFVYIGYLTKNIFLKRKNYVWLPALGIYLILAWFYAEKWTFDLHYAVLPDVLFYYLLGFLGIISVAGISQLVCNCSFFELGG